MKCLLFLFILQVLSATNLNNEKIHKKIIDWWTQEASVFKPLKCKLNLPFKEEFSEQFKQLLVKDDMRLTLFESRACTKSERVSRNFEFRGGSIVNGQLQGAGKLVLDHKFEFEKGLEHFNHLNVCLFRGKFRNAYVKEIVGTFQNGTLNGSGKMTFENGVTIISSNFQNGSCHGLQRIFNNKTLESVVFTQIASKPPKWERVGQFLVHLLDGSTFNTFDYSKKSFNGLLIPLDTSQEILTGLINDNFQIIEDVHLAEVKSANWEFCTPELVWKVGKKQNYDFSYKTKRIIRRFEEGNEICNGFGKNPEEDFVQWQEKVMHIDKVDLIFERLKELKTELSPVQIDKVKQEFISNMTIIEAKERKLSLNMSIWNGPINTWHTYGILVDENLQLNGFIHLSIDKDFVNKTGTHDFMAWSPQTIAGRFVKGVLQGVALIETWKGQIIFGTFVDGIWHGPAIGLGLVPILDMDVSTLIYNKYF